MKALLCSCVLFLCVVAIASAQEFTIRAEDWKNHKPLDGIPITLRYDCSSTGSGLNLKMHCKFLQRRTGDDGIAHFPEAGSLKDIDDIFSLPITYGAVCCDVQPKQFPGSATITFRRRSLSEMLRWIFIGD
jgi:hypothetical protein